MMTYEEMKDIAERYGIGISQGIQNKGGFIGVPDGEIKESIVSDLQSAFGILTVPNRYMYYEVDSMTDFYAA